MFLAMPLSNKLLAHNNRALYKMFVFDGWYGIPGTITTSYGSFAAFWLNVLLAMFLIMQEEVNKGMVNAKITSAILRLKILNTTVNFEELYIRFLIKTSWDVQCCKLPKLMQFLTIVFSARLHQFELLNLPQGETVAVKDFVGRETLG